MRRLFAIAVLLGTLAACSNPGPRILVYGFDDGPRSSLDSATCVSGVGLRIDLGPTESIGFDIAADQRTARLATCDLEGGQVVECAIFDPEIPLDIENDTVTSFVSVPATFENTDCSGADLEYTWTMQLTEEDTVVRGEVQLVWRLHDTPECDLFEAEILATAEGSGRVDGCVVNYEFTASKVAECRVDFDFLVCE